MKTRFMSMPALAAAVALSALALAKTPDFTDLAPDSTILAAGADNLPQARERLQATGLWDLWQTEQMQSFFQELMEEFSADMAGLCEELEIDKEAFTCPDGPVGFSLFRAMDEKSGKPVLGVMLMADCSNNAEKTDAAFNNLLKKGEDEEAIEYETEEVDGREIFTITMTESADEEFADDEFMAENDPMAGFADAFKTMHIARDHGVYLLCSDKPALDTALEAWSGEDTQTLGDRDEFVAMMDPVSGDDLWFAMLLRDVGPMIAAYDQMGMSMMAFPMLKQMFGDIKGLSAGYRLDGETAMIEQTAYVYMPFGKAGFTALLDTPKPRGDVPGFAVPNATNFAAVNFRAKGIPQAIMPLMLVAEQMGLGGQGDGPSPMEMIQQVTSYFGDEVYVVQWATKPLTTKSAKQLLAMQCEKPEEFGDFLGATLTPQGFEDREFLGHRLFSMDMSGMGMAPGMGGAPMDTVALGIGGGMVFMGETPTVEQALRTVGSGDQATLAGEALYQRAVSVLSDEPVVAWGYTDMITQAQTQVAVAELEMKEFIDDLKETDPEFAAELEEDGLMGGFGFLQKIEWDLIRQHIGPASWEAFSVENGFLMKSYTLSAED